MLPEAGAAVFKTKLNGTGSIALSRLAGARTMRLPLALLPLLAVATVLSFRVAIVLHPSSFPRDKPPWNVTWMRIAAGGPATTLEGEMEVDDVLRMTASWGTRQRSPALWRRLRRHESAVEATRLLSEMMRAFRDWSRHRRYEPGVMGELVGLVKRPVDWYRGVEGKSGRRYASCAVVGNSGILLQRELGALIDSHEFVIRLNNARINGYQRNVGSKTSMAFINSNILQLCSRRIGCFCHPYGEKTPIVMYICQALHFLDYIACNASHKGPLLVTDARFDILCSRIVKYYSLRRFVEETGQAPLLWYKFHDSKVFHYSSGMQAVMLAVGICDKVSIFGFGKSEEAKHHYHTNQKKELDLHDYKAEYLLYQDLIERPHAIPFLAESRFKVPPVVMHH